MKCVTKLKVCSDRLLGLAGLLGIVIMTVGVVLRYCFQVSLSWSDEFLRTLCVYIYFIGAAMAAGEGGLMRLELLDTALLKRERLRALGTLQKLQRAMEVVFFGAFGYEMVQMTLGLVGQTTTTSSTPAWVSPLGCTIGMIAITLIAAYRLLFEKKAAQDPA